MKWTTDFFSWHYAGARSFDLYPESYTNALSASELLQLQRRGKKYIKNLADSASQRKVWPCLQNAVVQGVCPEILRRDRKGRQVWVCISLCAVHNIMYSWTMMDQSPLIYTSSLECLYCNKTNRWSVTRSWSDKYWQHQKKAFSSKKCITSSKSIVT